MDITEIHEFPDHKLKKPLAITTFEIDGHYYISSNMLGIHADGDSKEEAMDCFEVLLEDFYNRAKMLLEMVE